MQFPPDLFRSFPVLLRQRENGYQRFTVKDVDVIAVDPHIVCRLIFPVQGGYVVVQAAACITVTDTHLQGLVCVLL
jgi:hypothetical protein